MLFSYPGFILHLLLAPYFLPSCLLAHHPLLDPIGNRHRAAFHYLTRVYFTAVLSLSSHYWLIHLSRLYHPNYTGGLYSRQSPSYYPEHPYYSADTDPQHISAASFFLKPIYI